MRRSGLQTKNRIKLCEKVYSVCRPDGWALVSEASCRPRLRCPALHRSLRHTRPSWGGAGSWRGQTPLRSRPSRVRGDGHPWLVRKRGFLGDRTMREAQGGDTEHCTSTTNRVHLYAALLAHHFTHHPHVVLEEHGEDHGCQEKIVPRSETRPEKGQAHPASTACTGSSAVPKPFATLT
jgi:hypothetical protein